MKIRHETIDKVCRECICDVGTYRYVLREIGYADGYRIERCEIRNLDRLPRYGSYWETVARYDMDRGIWVDPAR